MSHNILQGKVVGNVLHGAMFTVNGGTDMKSLPGPPIQTRGGENLCQVKIQSMFLFLGEPSGNLLAHQEHTPDVREGDPMPVHYQPSGILVLIELAMHELGPCFGGFMDRGLGHPIRVLHPSDASRQLSFHW